MRLEEITIENIIDIEDAELKKLKNRAEQLYTSTLGWKSHIKKNQMGLNDPIDKSLFIEKSTILFRELHKRRLIEEKSTLDAKLIKKAVTGIDTQDLPILIVKKDVANIGGDFVNNPQKAESVSLYVEKDFPIEIHKKLQSIIQKHTNKEVIESNITNEHVISLYDLVLMPKIITKVTKIDIKKAVNTELQLNFVKTDSKNTKSFTKNEEKHLVGGIVYETGVIDSDGDTILDEQDIWKAMETWAIDSNFIMKFMHEGLPVDVYPIESFQAEEDTVKGGQTIPKGAWYLTAKVLDESLWEACKSGEIGSFSMAGTCKVSILQE